jgi:hypothetical protein
MAKIGKIQIFIKWPEMQSATKKISQNELLVHEIRFDTACDHTPIRTTIIISQTLVKNRKFFQS